jgi:aminoglycoside phosphotransferase (APT) family kinase protein
MLAGSEVPAYLHALGLTGSDGVENERLEVIDASGRSRVYLAKVGSSGFVVKQWAPAERVLMAQEASVLDTLAAAGYPRFSPVLLARDSACGILVTDLLGDGENLAWYQRRAGVSVGLARAAGKVLGGLHRIEPAAIGRSAVDGTPPLALPPRLPPIELVREVSDGALEMIRLLQRSVELEERLELVRAAWRADAFIHGDVRWANWVPHAAPGSNRRTRLALVDWELARRGEPAYDLAAMLAEYLFTWIASIPVADGPDVARLVRTARFPLAALRPATRALWDAYMDERAGTPPSIRRVAELAAARLVQLTFEHANADARLHPLSGVVLQLSLGMLRSPTRAAVQLLDLPAEVRS